MKTKEIIEKIFKDPATQYELTEFETLGKPIHEIINIYPKVLESGREAGKTKYFMKSFVPFSSGKDEVQVYSEDGKSNPEEIVRQLWVYKLLNVYEYKTDEQKALFFNDDPYRSSDHDPIIVDLDLNDAAVQPPQDSAEIGGGSMGLFGMLSMLGLAVFAQLRRRKAIQSD